jgi:hypothetical protein
LAKEQNYGNHRRYFWPHHFIVQPVLALNFFVQLRDFGRDQNFDTGLAALVAFALLLLAVTARAQALKAQNRSIRLEERLRLYRLMPPEEHPKIDDLRMSQLIGLRFASDEEVADLARRCFSGELKGSGDVKKAVRNWRPDYHRV